MKEKIKKGLFILALIILIPVLALNLTIMIKALVNPDQVPSLFGYKPFVVLSGSMQSEIAVGDLVITKEVDANELEVNDIIAFRNSDSTITTHRIVSKLDDACFETKGDSNNVVDDEIVCSTAIEGKYVYKISKIGNFIIFIQEPVGFCVMMLSLLVIGLLGFIIVNFKIDQEPAK